MANRVAYVEAVFGADITNFRRGAAQVRRDLNILSDTAAGLSSIGRNMTFALTTPLVAAGTGAVALASSFDAAMRNVNSILFATEDQFGALSDRVLQLGGDLRAGPQAAAEALYSVVSAGYTDIDTAMEVAAQAAYTAEAGLADLQTTSEALAASMLAYGAGADEAAHYSDVLTRAVQVGVGEMSEFGNATGLVVSTAAAAGLSIDEMWASVSYLTQRGMSATRAATAMNRTIQGLIKPSEKMTQVFQQLGVASGRELIEQMGSFENAMIAIDNVAGHDVATLNELFTTAQGVRFPQSMFNDLEGLTNFMDEFAAATDGATEAAREQQNMSFAAHFDRLGAAVQTAGIAIGQVLLPVLRPVIDLGRELFLNLAQLSPEVLTLGVAAGAATAAIGPLLWIMGSLLSPVGLLAGAVTALGGAIAFNINGLGDKASQVLNDIFGTMTPLKNAILDFYNILTGSDEVESPAVKVKTWGDDALAEMYTLTDEAPTVWDIWQQQGQEAGWDSWTEFRDAFQEAVGDTPLNELSLGVSVSLGGGIDAWTKKTHTKVEDAWTDISEVPEEDNSLGARIARAVEEAGPHITNALQTIGKNISTWFQNDFIPGLDTLGGSVIDTLTSVFSGDDGEKGRTSPVYNFIRKLFSGGIGDAIGDLGSIFEENFPGITTALDNFISGIGDWLMNTGIPTFSRSAGYIFGTLASLISQGISSLFSGVFNLGRSIAKGDVGKAANQFSETVLQPFSEGFEQAKNDRGIVGGLEELFVDIAGLITTVGTAAFIGNLLLGRGLAGAFSGAFGLVFGAIKIGGKAISLLFSTIGGFIGGGAADAAASELGETVAETVTRGIGDPFSGVASEAIPTGGLVTGLKTWFTTAVAAVPWATLLGVGLVAAIGALTIAEIFAQADQEEQSIAARNAGFFLPDVPTVSAMDNTGMTMPDTYRDDSALIQQPGGYQNLWSAPPEEIMQEGQTAAENFVDGWQMYYDNGGMQDVLNQEIEKAFGAEGTATATLVDFGNTASIVAVPFNDAVSSINTMDTTFETVKNSIISGMEAVSTAAGGVLDPFIADVEAIGQDAFGGIVRIGMSILGIDGAFADGGSFGPNETILVGEQGPELLRTGSHGGTVIPNSGLDGAVGGGGGGTTVINNNITVQGGPSTDKLLADLRLRGIYLE